MGAKLNYQFAADALAAKTGVPPALLCALINAESAWNPSAVSKTGATGLGQFTTATAKEYGLMGDDFDNRKDAALNMTAMVRYLADLRKTNDSWKEVVGHYSGQRNDGQADFSAGYARYSAGQALIATIASVDGEPPPPPPGNTPPAPVHLAIEGTQSGKPVPIIVGALAVFLLAAAVGATHWDRSPSVPNVAAVPPPSPAKAGFDWSGSTFYFNRDMTPVPVGR